MIIQEKNQPGNPPSENHTPTEQNYQQGPAQNKNLNITKSQRKKNTACSNIGQAAYELQLHFYPRQAWSSFGRSCVLFWSSTVQKIPFLSWFLSNLSRILEYEPQHSSRFELCPKVIYFKSTIVLQLKAFYTRVPLLKYTENKVIPFQDSSTSGCRFSMANYFVQNSLTLKAE